MWAPPVHYLQAGLGGDQKVKVTLREMARLIREGSKNWEVRSAATQLIRDVRERDEWGEVSAIFDFIQSFARYTLDPDETELLHSADISLRLIREQDFAALDCDDYTILGLALLKSIGYPVGLKVISLNADREFEHVYGLVLLKTGWIPFDAIKKEALPLGWEVLSSTRSWSVEV
jgi:transglutaminase-like putative cysteine protease